MFFLPHPAPPLMKRRRRKDSIPPLAIPHVLRGAHKSILKLYTHAINSLNLPRSLGKIAIVLKTMKGCLPIHVST